MTDGFLTSRYTENKYLWMFLIVTGGVLRCVLRPHKHTDFFCSSKFNFLQTGLQYFEKLVQYHINTHVSSELFHTLNAH